MAAIIVPAVSGGSPNELVLRAATAAYLGRYRGQTRVHSESDLRVFLRWCTDQDLDPLAVGGWTSNGTCAGCKTSVATNPRRSRGGCRWWSASTGSASSTRSWRIHRPTTSAVWGAISRSDSLYGRDCAYTVRDRPE